MNTCQDLQYTVDWTQIKSLSSNNPYAAGSATPDPAGAFYSLAR